MCRISYLVWWTNDQQLLLSTQQARSDDMLSQQAILADISMPHVHVVILTRQCFMFQYVLKVTIITV